MDHFRIIQTLCRIGLGAGNPAFKFQVDRLAKALRSAGESREAQALEDLIRNTNSDQLLKPSRLVASAAAAIPGEQLTPRVTPPVDRETGADLAEVQFPPKDADLPPVLGPDLDAAVQRLIEEWGHVEELARVGAAPSRTCLLFGRPGTGKTKLAHYICQQLNLPIVLARLDGLISSFLGTTARNIGSLFEFANRYRCVLLLDEFDAIAKLRDDPQEVGEIKRVVNALLQNIDKRSVSGFTIAITNHEALLDSAVWRRFEARIQVPIPKEPERQQILERFLDPLPIERASLAFLGWISDEMTGSDIEVMVRSIKRFAAVHGRDDFSLLDALRSFAITNASAVGLKRLELLLGSLPEIARQVMAESVLGLTQQELGSMLGKDQTTISRWLKQDPAEKAAVNAE